MNCIYLRIMKLRNRNKYYCVKLDKYIESCDSCKYRKHSRIKELTASVKEITKDPKLAPKDLEKQRWKECKKCEHLKSRRCKICGCFLDVKIKFQATHCPRRKW